MASVARNKVMLACTECKQRNYNSMKNKKNTPDRIELNKYCRFCKKQRLTARPSKLRGGQPPRYLPDFGRMCKP